MNNYTEAWTKTPNWVLEAILLGLFKPREVRVLGYFVRHTLGYHRDTIYVKPKAIAEHTGLQENHARTAFNTLVEKGVLLESEEGIRVTWEQPKQLLSNNQNGCENNQIGCTEATETVGETTKSVAGKQPNRLEKTTKMVAETTLNPASGAGSVSPKENSKEKEDDHDPLLLVSDAPAPTSGGYSPADRALLEEAAQGLKLPPTEIPLRIRGELQKRTAKNTAADSTLEAWDKMTRGEKAAWAKKAMAVAREKATGGKSTWLGFAVSVIVNSIEAGETIAAPGNVLPFQPPSKPETEPWEEFANQMRPPSRSDLEQLAFVASRGVKMGYLPDTITERAIRERVPVEGFDAVGRWLFAQYLDLMQHKKGALSG